MCGPAQMCLQDLTHVHTRRNTERVEHDLDRCAVGQVRHVFLGKDAGNDTLVPVAAGHLVTYRQLALHGDVDLDQLDHAWRQFITLLQLGDLLVGDLAQHIDLTRGHFLDLVNLFVDARILVGVANALQVTGRNALDGVAIDDLFLHDEALVGALVVQVSQHFFAAQNRFQPLQPLVGQNADFVGQVLFKLGNLLAFDQLGALVLLLTLAGEDANVHYGAFDTWRAGQRCVANVAGLFAEDCAQQLLFRRQLGFALGRYFADQDVVVLDLGADADDSALVEVAQCRLGDVGNITRDFFRSQLGVARFDFKLLDVHRGVVIVADQLFGNQNRVLEVVTAPGHEGHQHVTPEGQFALLRARTIGDHLPLDHPVALANNWLLIDTSVLVGTLELDQLVDVRTNFAGQLGGMMLTLHADDNALGVDRIDDAVALGQDHGAGVARGDAFHPGADQRRFRHQQGNRLALHVGAHECAVGVVVLQERHQRSGNRDQLLGAHVDVIHLCAIHQHKVALAARVDQIVH